ncbi:MAG: membrane protein insertase YidC [Deltaproteobacteria bacterium]|nr:MAG: membrane protein insertase YidC [Deltaproteobacteria bacterium]PIE73002.1 MAG: membrane protein insertase YidC [Deltaproteobacteria bacterium]
MDSSRAFLAILISLAILIGYQYLFVGFEQPPADSSTERDLATQTSTPPSSPPEKAPAQEAVAPPVIQKQQETVHYSREPRQIQIETDLYRATLSEDGGTLTSFILKDYKQTHEAESPDMQLIQTDAKDGFPLRFTWGTLVKGQLLYESDRQRINLGAGKEKEQLVLTAQTDNGLTVVRTYSFDNTSYLVDLQVKVFNTSGTLLQGVPELGLVNRRFAVNKSPAGRFLFVGPSAYVNGELNEIDLEDEEGGRLDLQGAVDWAGYGSNYFLCAIIPAGGDDGKSFTAQGSADIAYGSLAGSLDTLESGAEKSYDYHLFFGPKKLKMLKEIGYNLDRSVNFGWFDVIAKPVLWLLNLFYSFCRNYGIAIILVTVLIKALFWPISQKGMKSMKNMQKLQPKMVKIKEKYKDDPTRMNQEVMNLYKTYKVNPLGGCLPMVLQIPVFFALYKVLLLSIELRHAPFMLWITDLSAPDRLYLGFDIPYLGGLPVLTLLMGASMFLQQKLTPTTADPTQAKIMMFLPIIFTFMFINFASGLVLYWFVNNLLSILQQVMINRERKTPATAES